MYWLVFLYIHFSYLGLWPGVYRAERRLYSSLKVMWLDHCHNYIIYSIYQLGALHLISLASCLACKAVLTFKVFLSNNYRHMHACLHTCDWQGKKSRSSQGSLLCPELYIWAMKQQIMGTEDTCKITAAVHIYCFDIAVPLILWIPSGLGLHFAFKSAVKSPALLWNRDSGLKQPDLCFQGKNTRTWGCQTLQ